MSSIERPNVRVQHIVVQWEPRPEPVAAIAKQVAAVMEWLRAIEPLDGTWSAAPPGSLSLAPCSGIAEIEAALVSGARPFPTKRAPAPPTEFYKQDFYLGRLRSWRARLEVVAGATAPVAGLHLVNRVHLAVRSPLPAPACRQVLVGLVGALRPVTAFSGLEALVDRSLTRGAPPPVGHFTFLSTWFGAAPPLPASVRVSPMKSFGTLLQAFEGEFDPASPAHAAALTELEGTLRTSGWLRPFSSTP